MFCYVPGLLGLLSDGASKIPPVFSTFLSLPSMFIFGISGVVYTLMLFKKSLGTGYVFGWPKTKGVVILICIYDLSLP